MGFRPTAARVESLINLTYWNCIMLSNSIPPSTLLMQISNSPSQEDFINSFPHVRDEVGKYLARTGRRLDNFENILDFGCGVGRFAYALKPILADHQKLYGCDLDEECANWCARHAGYEEVVRNSLEPSLPWADGSFDFIYALSVFTHLSMEHQFPWAWELCRILKPNGVLMFSTHGLGQLLPGLLDGDAWNERHAYLINGEGLITTLAQNEAAHIEGQREVAVFHNREALLAQFDSLTLRLRDSVSTMAGGQSMNIFSKGNTEVHRATQGNGSGSRIPGEISIKAEFCIGDSELCCYFEPANVIFNADGYQAVARLTNDPSALVGRAAFSVVASHGKNHLLEFRFLLSCDAGQWVTLEVLDRSGCVIPGQWHFPHWLEKH